MKKIKVLFICMGNICRSPTAQGVFSKLIEEWQLHEKFKIDSAGTHAYHIGEEPDLRAQKAAQERGIRLKHLRARKVEANDFSVFDHLLVMDADNYRHIVRQCPKQHRHKVAYFLDYAPHLPVREVPDPYYGGDRGFERVLDMIEQASIGFLDKLKQTGEI